MSYSGNYEDQREIWKALRHGTAWMPLPPSPYLVKEEDIK